VKEERSVGSINNNSRHVGIACEIGRSSDFVGELSHAMSCHVMSCHSSMHAAATPQKTR
jgi:hypothetical protein